jgi:hypothetical protein
LRVIGDQLVFWLLADLAAESAPFLDAAGEVARAVAVSEGRSKSPAHRPAQPTKVAHREAGRFAERRAGRRAIATLLLDCGFALVDRGDQAARAVVAQTIARRGVVAYFPEGIRAPGERIRATRISSAEANGLLTLVTPRIARGELGPRERRDLRRGTDRLVRALDGIRSECLVP